MNYYRTLRKSRHHLYQLNIELHHIHRMPIGLNGVNNRRKFSVYVIVLRLQSRKMALLPNSPALTSHVDSGRSIYCGNSARRDVLFINSCVVLRQLEDP